MWVTQDTLTAAVENLEQTLADHRTQGSRIWAARLDQALFSIQQTIRGQSVVLKTTADGGMNLGSEQAPSPALDRRVHRLRHDLADLLDEASALRSQVGRVLERTSPAAPAGRSFNGFSSRLDNLLEGLSHYEHEAARLIQETANTDLGAGD